MRSRLEELGCAGVTAYSALREAVREAEVRLPSNISISLSDGRTVSLGPVVTVPADLPITRLSKELLSDVTVVSSGFKTVCVEIVNKNATSTVNSDEEESIDEVCDSCVKLSGEEYTWGGDDDDSEYYERQGKGEDEREEKGNTDTKGEMKEKNNDLEQDVKKNKLKEN